MEMNILCEVRVRSSILVSELSVLIGSSACGWPGGRLHADGP